MDERRSRMAWFGVRLSEEEQGIVERERREHPHEPTRRKLETLWLLHHGLTREKVAEVMGVRFATGKRHVKGARAGGLVGLRHWGKRGQPGSLEYHREWLAESFREQPVRSVAEAA